MLGFQLVLDLLLGIPLLLVGTGKELGPGLAGAEAWGAPSPVAGAPDQADLPRQFHVFWEEVRRLAADGEPPWISDRIGGGAALYAHGQSGVPFPLNAPVWLLGAEKGTTVLGFWKLELAALGGFLLLRRLRLLPSVAAAGALSYGFGTWAVSWLVVPIGWVTALTPWAFLLLLATLRGSRWAGSGLALLLGSLCGWSVHPETAVFLSLGVAAAGATMAAGNARRWRRLPLPAVLALLVSAIGALPLLASIRGSAKLGELTAPAGGTFSRIDYTWPVRGELAALALVPFRHGVPSDGTWRLPVPMAPVALSIGGALFAAGFAALPRRRHRRLALAFGALWLLSAALCFQLPGPAHLLALVPVVKVMVWNRAGFLFAFATAVLLALSADALFRLRELRGRAGAAPALAVSALFLVVLAVAPRPWHPAAVAAAAVPLCGAGLLAFGGRAAAPGLAALAAAGGALHLGLLLPVSAPARAPNALLERLRELRGSSDERVLVSEDAFPANLAAPLGLADLRADDPVRSIPLARLHGAFGSAGESLPGPVTRPDAALAGAWGVRWLIAPGSGVPPASEPGWVLRSRSPEGTLYENARARPVFRVVGDARELVPGRAGPTLALGGSAAATVAERRPWRLRANVTVSGRVAAVLHVPYETGWRAFVDGRESPVELVDVAAMAVVAGEGRHVVEFRYAPPLLGAGAAATGLGLLGAMAPALGALRRRKRGSRAAASSGAAPSSARRRSPARSEGTRWTARRSAECARCHSRSAVVTT